MYTLNRRYGSLLAGLCAFSLLFSSGGLALASSHREAPLTSGDPKIDGTDLYAFVSPDKPNTVTLIADYLPFEEPAGGPNFYSFDDKALYAINIDNNGDAIPDITYQFTFKTTIQNPSTFLYNTGPISSLGDPNFNIRQTYTLTKVENGQSTILGSDIPVPPVNVGPKSTPDYGTLQAQAVRTLPGGIEVFAGQSDDPFFVELGGLFDLLTVRNLPGNAGGGVDGLKGYNVHSLALQIPISQLTSNKIQPTSATDTAAVIGVWTTASRLATHVIAANPSANSSSGDWVQVSRLGAPLVNEVVVPVGSKDIWNGSQPKDDAQFAAGVADPELGKLLKGLFGINVPPQGPFGSSTQRDDLEAIFLTGIPGLNKPAQVTPAEELRLNMAIMPSANPNRLGVLGGDNQGFPNGRRLADDVTDIELRAVAGAAYPLFHPGFTPDPTALKLGDGVDANDVAFRSTFPYLALPHQGFESVPHGTVANAIAGTGGGGAGGITSTSTNTAGTTTSTTTGSMSTTTGSNPSGGSLWDNIQSVLSQIHILQQQLQTLIGQFISSGGSSTGSTTPPMQTNSGRLQPAAITVRKSSSIDFSGRNFGHEETVSISRNGTQIGTAHADGGGNFTTGSLSVPSTPGIYTYTFIGQKSGDSQASVVTVTP